VTQPLGVTVKLFEATKIPVLTKALDAYAMRHKAIASNVANITTAGYRAKSVVFEEELAGALRQDAIGGVRTNEKHMAIGASRLAEANPTTVEEKPNGDTAASGYNNVDLDNEMAELAKNQLRFRFSARMVAEAFRGIQKSIRGTV